MIERVLMTALLCFEALFSDASGSLRDIQAKLREC